MDIVLDTNIVVADFGLRGTAFRVTFDGVRRTDCKLLVPEVVVHEAVAKWREALTDAVEQQRKGGELIQRLTQRVPLGPTLDTDEETRRFEAGLRARLLESGADFLPWPSVAHRSVVERILGGRRPTRKDAGYRDTLIWETLLEYVAAKRPDAVVFVTANVRDFCEEERLHPHLAQDLVRAGFPENLVSIETSLAGFNKRVFEPTLALLAKAKDEIGRGEHRGVDLRAWLRRHLSDLLEGDLLRGAAIDLPEGCGRLYLSSGAEILAFAIEEVRQLSSGELFVEAEAKIGGELDISLTERDYERFSEAREWIGPDYSGGHVSISVRQEFTATFESILGEGDVLSSEVTAMAGDYGDWKVA